MREGSPPCLVFELVCGGNTWECCLCLPQKETLLGAVRQWVRAGGAPGKGPSPQFLAEVG